MNKIMFAAVFSAVMLLFVVVATAYELVPDAEAAKARGKYLKDVGTSKRDRTPSQVCGDELCDTLKNASTGLRKGELRR